jgi:hypothetical protein
MDRQRKDHQSKEPRESGSGAALEAEVWMPEACTLPSVQRPLRVAEFTAFFAEEVRDVRRDEPGRLRLSLRNEPRTAGRAAELMARETGCCSFFTFTLTATGGELSLEIDVPGRHVEVLDALAAHAASATLAGPAR